MNMIRLMKRVRQQRLFGCVHAEVSGNLLEILYAIRLQNSLHESLLVSIGGKGCLLGHCWTHLILTLVLEIWSIEVQSLPHKHTEVWSRFTIWSLLYFLLYPFHCRY